MQFNIEPGQTSWFDQTPEYKKLYFADQARKREVRLFYLHIPKTGGKYMNEVFKNYNGPLFKVNNGRLVKYTN